MAVALRVSLLLAVVVAAVATTHALDGPGTPTARVVYAAAAPGVVDVSARVPLPAPTPFGPATGTERGAGSVVDRAGHVLTVRHVVAHATAIRVRLADGTVRAARLVVANPRLDVALLRIDPAGLTLHPLPLGTAGALHVGDPLYAIGAPFGFSRSLSTGVVSALDRTIRTSAGGTVRHALQTDAALNPGDSGGPLLDGRGRVVGVVDQIATTGATTTSTGVGFAVSIDAIRSLLAPPHRGSSGF